MGVCAGSKRDGSSCTIIVESPKQYCWWHDPSNSNQRKRSAAKAGRSKPNRELADLKSKIEQLAEDVLEGKVPTGRGAITNQVYNTLIRCLELERRLKETEELEGRISAIEQRQSFGAHKGGRKTW